MNQKHRGSLAPFAELDPPEGRLHGPASDSLEPRLRVCQVATVTNGDARIRRSERCSEQDSDGFHRASSVVLCGGKKVSVS